MRGSPREVRPGVWRLVFDLPKGAGNKRQQKRVTFYGGARAAQKELSRLITEAGAGNIAPANRITVEQYLIGWLEKRAGDSLSPKTLETWQVFTNAYLVPHLGKVPLNKLTAAQVEQCYATLRREGLRRGAGGLSPRTVLHIHRLLSEALKSAVRLQLIPRNPCDAAAPRGVAMETRPTIDPAALKALLEASRGHWLHTPILLAAGMGLRRGECLGLRWSDVDFKSGTVTIAQTLQQVRGEHLFKTPKTENSRRTIGLPEFVAVELRKLRVQQLEHSTHMGDQWQDAGLVVQQPDTGAPRSPGGLTHAFADLAVRAGLPTIHFHDLRHCHATLLLLAKVDTKIVSARLGHSSTRITQDLYQHILPAMDQDATAKADAFLREAMG